MTPTNAPVHEPGLLAKDPVADQLEAGRTDQVAAAATDRSRVDDLTARTLSGPAVVVVGVVAQ